MRGCRFLFAGSSLVTKCDLQPGLGSPKNFFRFPYVEKTFFRPDFSSLKVYDSNFDSRTFKKTTPISSLIVGLQRSQFHNHAGLIVECLKRVKAM